MKICGAVPAITTGSFVAVLGLLLLLLLVGPSAVGSVHQSEQEENIFRRNGYDMEEAGLTASSTEVRFCKWCTVCILHQ